MKSEDVYNWYLKNGKLDYDVLSIMQRECFNKPIQPVEKIDYKRLHDILYSDRRFNDNRLLFVRWWIFDLEYAVIDKQILTNILDELKGITNEWTIVAIVQSITGLNCGFIWGGRRLSNDNEVLDEVDGYGFIAKDGNSISIITYDNNSNEVGEGDVIIGYLVFD